MPAFITVAFFLPLATAKAGLITTSSRKVGFFKPLYLTPV